MSDWSFIAQRAVSREILDWDLPLTIKGIEWQLSGSGSLSATVEPDVGRLRNDDGRLLLEEWGTFIYAEYQGEIKWGGILIQSTFNGEAWDLEAAGFSSYLHARHFQGELSELDYDVADAVRAIWHDVQRFPDGNLGMTVTGTRSTGVLMGVRGTPDMIVAEDNSLVPLNYYGSTVPEGATIEKGEPDEPYTLLWYEAPNCGDEMDELAKIAPFEWVERHAWNADHETIRHEFNMVYPRLGTRRDDLSFVQGDNVTNIVAVDSNGDDFANVVIGLGAGEGRAMIRQEAAVRDGRLRREHVHADKAVTANSRLAAVIADQLDKRRASVRVETIDVIDHPNARIGSWNLGDEVLVRADLPWLGSIDMWARVVGWTLTGDDTATLALTRIVSRDPAQQLASEISSLRKEVRSGSRGTQLGNSGLENGAIPIFDKDGNQTGSIGMLPDGTTGFEVVAGPPPPTPTAPIVFPLVGGLEVTWDGECANGRVLPGDFRAVEVHASPDPNFIPTAFTLRASFISAGTIILQLPDDHAWTIKFVMRSTAGVGSAPSVGATETPEHLPTMEEITEVRESASDAESAARTANEKALEAAGIAASKGKVYTQNEPPDGDPNGLWIDLNDGNKPYRWDEATFSWVAIPDASIAQARARADQAIADAADALAKSDGKVNTYFQQTAPTGLVAADVGDLWFDNDDKNKLYRWNGSSWVLASDQSIVDAINAANTAQSTANSKIVTFYQEDPPPVTGRTVGDLWVDTNDGNKLYRWSGSIWANARDTGIQSAFDAAGNAATAAANALKAAQDATYKADQAGLAATAAQTSADGKNRVFFRALNNPPPEPLITGDLWFQTDQGNRPMKRENGQWIAATFGDNALAGLNVGKLTTGVLAAGQRIIAGDNLGTRIELAPDGLTSIRKNADGSSTTTGRYETSTGSWSMAGEFRSTATNGRMVYLSSNLGVSSGGKATGQAGIVFPSTDGSRSRFSQLYDNGMAVVLDSPSFSSNLSDGISRGGSSLAVEARGIFAYTEGANATNQFSDALQIRNDGYWRLGRVDVPGRSYAEAGPGFWRVGNIAAGSQVYGQNDGYWMVGDVNGDKAQIVSDPGGGAIHITNDMAFNSMHLYPNGTWSVGHNGAQAVYGIGERLVLRDRQVSSAGGIDAYVSNGSWFDVWTGDNGGTQGGMFVHGRFGANIKNFVIDHPTKPDHQLVHSSTESPTAGVEYWGTVDLDARGEAVVTLPDYFEALTHIEGRAVLITPVGKPVAVGASEVVDGKFTVYGANKGKVSWLVKASRKDSSSVFEVEPLKEDRSAESTPPDSGDPVPPAEPPENMPPGWSRKLAKHEDKDTKHDKKAEQEMEDVTSPPYP